ncbi:MAG: cytochrome c3 family protein [Myxococcales bacterium]|nr:cytochrome c3 family protein [Myxococcales bacterium]
MRRALILALLLLLGTGAACATVLGIKPPGRAVFPHRAHVTKGIACTRCHEGMDSAGEDGPLHIPDTTRCVECHVDPHDARTCSNCHSAELSLERVKSAKHHLRFEHQKHLPVVASNCARCHVEVAEAERPLLPPMAACLACHEHEGTFQDASCEQCHVDLEVEQSRPASHLVHDEDYVNRHGPEAAASRALCDSCHTERQCASCHGANVPALPQRLNFDRPELGGLHRAGFASRHDREAKTDPGLCFTCHTETSCQRCHEDRGIAGANATRNPHPAGWVGIGQNNNAHGAAAWSDPASCAGCHSGAGEALCVNCHKVGGVGGNIHPPGWTSKRSLAEAPCRLCHDGLTP